MAFEHLLQALREETRDGRQAKAVVVSADIRHSAELSPTG